MSYGYPQAPPQSYQPPLAPGYPPPQHAPPSGFPGYPGPPQGMEPYIAASAPIGDTYQPPPPPGPQHMYPPPQQAGSYYAPPPPPQTTVIVKEKDDGCAKDCCLCALCMGLCCLCCQDWADVHTLLVLLPVLKIGPPPEFRWFTKQQLSLKWKRLVFYTRCGHHSKCANNEFGTRYRLDCVRYDTLYPWKGKGCF